MQFDNITDQIEENLHTGKWLTMQQAAKVIGIKRQALYYYAERGELSLIRLGRVYVDRDELDRFWHWLAKKPKSKAAQVAKRRAFIFEERKKGLTYAEIERRHGINQRQIAEDIKALRSLGINCP